MPSKLSKTRNNYNGFNNIMLILGAYMLVQFISVGDNVEVENNVAETNYTLPLDSILNGKYITTSVIQDRLDTTITNNDTSIVLRHLLKIEKIYLNEEDIDAIKLFIND
jgi:hypothetical protein